MTLKVIVSWPELVLFLLHIFVECCCKRNRLCQGKKNLPELKKIHLMSLLLTQFVRGSLQNQSACYISTAKLLLELKVRFYVGTLKIRVLIPKYTTSKTHSTPLWTKYFFLYIKI